MNSSATGQVAFFGALAIWFVGIPSFAVLLSHLNEKAKCRGTCPHHYMCATHCSECCSPLVMAFVLDIALIIGWVMFWNWMGS